MPQFIVSFEDNKEPGVTLAEYTVEAYLEGDAIDTATEMFNTEHPGWQENEITKRSRNA